jgi:hypothetical protein
MASIVLSDVPLANLKNLTRDAFVGVKSSHLSEAIAASLGFRTHASLLAALTQSPHDADIVRLAEDAFRRRLEEFDYAVPVGFSFEDLIEPRWSVGRKSGRRKRINKERPDAHQTTLISTMCHNEKVNYTSTRAKAWRNLLVAGVNEALRLKLFTLRPGDNRWTPDEFGDCRYEFELPNGMPAVGFLHDASFDEVQVFVTVKPRAGMPRYMSERQPGAASGFGFVERRRGAWLQSGESTYHGMRAVTPVLAVMDLEPRGYGDRGAVIM